MRRRATHGSPIPGLIFYLPLHSLSLSRAMGDCSILPAARPARSCRRSVQAQDRWLVEEADERTAAQRRASAPLPVPCHPYITDPASYSGLFLSQAGSSGRGGSCGRCRGLDLSWSVQPERKRPPANSVSGSADHRWFVSTLAQIPRSTASAGFLRQGPDARVGQFREEACPSNQALS